MIERKIEQKGEEKTNARRDREKRDGSRQVRARRNLGQGPTTHCDRRRRSHDLPQPGGAPLHDIIIVSTACERAGFVVHDRS